MSGDRRIIGLDILRCCAIGGVVLSHGLVFLYPHVPALPVGGGRHLHLYHLGHAGYYGVELFFVLSGFLIGGLLLNIGSGLSQGTELIRFYCRRWFRTLPNYYLFLLINLALIIWVFPQVVPWPKVAPYLLFLQTFSGRHTFFFLESWSLCIEEWFYLLFPLLVALVLRTKRNFNFAFLFVGILLYVGSSLGRFAYAGDPANTWADDIRETVLIRFDALMTGILAAWFFSRRPRLFGSAPRLCAVAGGLLLLACYCTLYWYQADNETLFAKTVRFNVVSLGFALLLPLAARTLATRYRWFNVSVESLARWSYSMYLVHLPLQRCLSERTFPKYLSSGSQGWAAFALFAFGTIVLSALLYGCFEHPLTELRERFAPPRRVVPVTPP